MKILKVYSWTKTVQCYRYQSHRSIAVRKARWIKQLLCNHKNFVMLDQQTLAACLLQLASVIQILALNYTTDWQNTSLEADAPHYGLKFENQRMKHKIVDLPVSV